MTRLYELTWCLKSSTAFSFSYLCSMIKQQCYSISVAQVSVDTQQGGVVEDIATVIHISPSHNQQSAHLQKEKRKVTAELWWEIHSCVCEYALLPWYWGCRGCAVTQEQGSGSGCCMTATALAELRRKPLASYSGPGWGEQMWQKPTVRHKTVASHWFVICKKIYWCGFQPMYLRMRV